MTRYWRRGGGSGFCRCAIDNEKVERGGVVSITSKTFSPNARAGWSSSNFRIAGKMFGVRYPGQATLVLRPFKNRLR
jgi:hypothetical protein